MEYTSYSSKANAVRAGKQKLAKATNDLLVIDIQGIPFRTSEGVDAWYVMVEIDMDEATVSEGDRALLEGLKTIFTDRDEKGEEPAPAKPAKVKAEKEAKPYVAGKSIEKGATKRVWEIADSMPDAKRGEVIEACMAAGIAMGTARTQYQKWKTARVA